MTTLSLEVSDFNHINSERTSNLRSGIVFIDPKVDDYETLSAGVSPGLEVVMLDGSRDGISQITAALKKRRSLSSLHIVAHGEAGSLWLGKGFVNSNTLEESKDDLTSWGEALAPDADILLYGCQVAACETGEQFVEKLSKLTGANVAASRNLTGSAQLGGDWQLEVKTGKIQSPLAFLDDTMEVYAAVFATNLVSVGAGGTQANGYSYAPSISADGRYVAFTSAANNLVSSDTNNIDDVFLYDRQTNITTRISVGTGGTEGNSFSYIPSISADGRYVTFTSAASNLVSDDTNSTYDIFVYDTKANTTSRVSVGTGGTQGNGASFNSSISADGRYVAFYSEATNLVSGDSNGIGDIFVYDRQNNTTSLVSVGLSGTPADNISFDASISADGRYVAFYSYASNLVSGDTNNTSDIFVYDRQTKTTSRVSVATGGTQGNGYSYAPSISADGRYVAFESDASNLVSGDTNYSFDIFVYDRQTNKTKRISVANDGTQGNGYSYGPSISADGRYVTFSSYATNLVSGDINGNSDVFVYDTQTNTISRVSINNDGTQGNGYSYGASISADGSYVAFSSDSNNLVSGDTNNSYDVFVYARGFGTQNPWTGTPDNDSYIYTGSANFAGYGLAGNDTITGGIGDDTLVGGEGNDSLSGLGGNDLLNGSTGNDSMAGGTGDDSYLVESIGDVVTENPNEGIDTVYSSVSYILGANVENLTLAGISNLYGNGNILNNLIIGNSGNNVLYGDWGSDTLEGGEGNDYLFSGNYNYISDNSTDSLSGGNGNDTLIAAYGADTLEGGDGDDYLFAYDGNDILNGGAGEDMMFGGAGNDIYYVDDYFDQVTENLNEGTDTVYSSTTYTLSKNIENLALTGTSNLNGGGNTLNNLIIGNSGNNALYGDEGSDILMGGDGNDFLFGMGGNDSLFGNAGNDILSGGIGNNEMSGGTGDDTYYVNSTGDVITENPNEGTDTVYSSVSYQLAANVENLILNFNAIRGFGNSLNNIIYGNDQANTLSGLAGNDRIYGGSGNDTISGGYSNDALYGEDGNDFLTGEQGNDLLSGGDGNDVLVGYGNGFAEIDTFIGGAGADIFGVSVNFARSGGSSGIVGYINDGNAGCALIQDFDTTDKIELKGSIGQYTFKQENILGSATLDTTIYYNGTGGLDLIAVVQDTTTVAASNLLFFS